MNISKFLSHFEGVNKNQNGFQARCPVHEDQRQSLSVSEVEGKILLHCHAGCETDTILNKIGLTFRDLHTNGQDRSHSKIVAEYVYTDEKGVPLYKSVRTEPKGFFQMRYESGKWITGVNDVRRVPYNLPKLISAIETGEIIYVVEGEKDCQTLAKFNKIATTNVGGAGKWRSEYNTHFKDAEVVIIPDNDSPGIQHSLQIAKYLSGIAKSLKVLHLPVTKEKEDVTDWINAGATIDELERMVNNTTDYKPGSIKETSETQSDKKEKKKTKEKQGQAIAFNDPLPHIEPVDGMELYDEIYSALNKFISCGEAERHAITLWIFHTHCFDASECTPILGISSPVKRCGKTTLLGLIKELTPRSISTSNVSAAVLFRIIEKAKPTVLIDEGDCFLKEKIELRGIINAGHTRNDAVVLRCDGDDFEPRCFDIYTPKSIAMIGSLKDLSDTVQDRAIEIKLQRVPKGESVEKFRRKQREGLREIHAKLKRWANDNIDALIGAEPRVPDALNDRAADSWEPLLAIADHLGQGNPNIIIPDAARRAALRLSGEEEANSIGLEILNDIRGIFEHRERDAITTADLLHALNKLEEAPWSGYHKGKELSGRGLAKLLKPFNISSDLMRFDGIPARGFKQKDFENSFKRYLPPSTSVTSVTCNNNNDLGAYLSVTGENFVTDKNGHKSNKNNDVTDVTDTQGVGGDLFSGSND